MEDNANHRIWGIRRNPSHWFYNSRTRGIRAMTREEAEHVLDLWLEDADDKDWHVAILPREHWPEDYLPAPASRTRYERV